MNEDRFACSLNFKHAWRATPAQICTLLDRMTDFLISAGIKGLNMGGDINEGTLEIAFDSPRLPDGSEGDSLWGLAHVVKALNHGRVSAPGWPDDEVVDGAIASVRVIDFALIPA